MAATASYDAQQPTDPSDSEDESVESEEPVAVPPTAKRVRRKMTEEERAARIPQLAKAREKALEVRRNMAELKKREKEAHRQAVKDRLAQLERLERAREAKAKKPPPEEEPAAPSKKAAKRAKAVHVVDIESSEEEEVDETDYRAKYLALKKKAKAGKAAAAQPEPVMEAAKQILQSKLQKQSHGLAYASLFPGAQNPFA